MDALPRPEVQQDQGVALSTETDFDQLLEVLVRAEVPVDDFGTGPAKTVQHLLDEVQSGESVIHVQKTGEILRELRVLWVDVMCELSNGDIYVLREDRQEFKDGRVKRRALNASLGEKLKPGETPEDAVQRALEEELGVQRITNVYDTGYEEKTLTPDTYPGVKSSYQFYKFATVIPESEFKLEGYVEDQPDKTNYYVWELLRPQQ